MAGGAGDFLGNPFVGMVGSLINSVLKIPGDAQAFNNNLHQFNAGQFGALRQGQGNDAAPGQITLNEQYDLLGRAIPGTGTVYNLPESTLPALRNLGMVGAGRIQNDTQSNLADFRNMAGQLTGMLNAGGARVLNDYNSSMSPITQGYQDRYSRGMANLEGMGNQAKSDLNRDYQANAGRIESDLAARGLGNSTIRLNVLQGNERERQDTLGRLNESIRAQRLATDAGLSADALGARTQQAMGANSILGNNVNNEVNLATSLGQQQLGIKQGGRAQLTDWQNMMGNAELQQQNQAYQNFFNSLGSNTFAYPQDVNPVNALLGQGIGSHQGWSRMWDFTNKQARPETQFLNSLAGGAGGALSGFAMSPLTGLGNAASTGFQNLGMGQKWGYNY